MIFGDFAFLVGSSLNHQARYACENPARFPLFHSRFVLQIHIACSEWFSKPLVSCVFFVVEIPHVGFYLAVLQNCLLSSAVGKQEILTIWTEIYWYSIFRNKIFTLSTKFRCCCPLHTWTSSKILVSPILLHILVTSYFSRNRYCTFLPRDVNFCLLIICLSFCLEKLTTLICWKTVGQII